MVGAGVAARASAEAGQPPKLLDGWIACAGTVVGLVVLLGFAAATAWVRQGAGEPAEVAVYDLAAMRLTVPAAWSRSAGAKPVAVESVDLRIPLADLAGEAAGRLPDATVFVTLAPRTGAMPSDLPLAL